MADCWLVRAIGRDRKYPGYSLGYLQSLRCIGPGVLRVIVAAMSRQRRFLEMLVPVPRAVIASLGRCAEFQKRPKSLVVNAHKTRELFDWQPPEIVRRGLQFVVGSDSARGTDASPLGK